MRFTQEFKDRLSVYMTIERGGLSQQELGKEIGVSGGGISMMLRDLRSVNLSNRGVQMLISLVGMSDNEAVSN